MRPVLASLFDSLDGVMYFFVSSGIFVLVTATMFFGLGLWIGSLTWGRFKRRFRASQETIEDLKNELALLKRRTAELASRALSHQSGRVRAAAQSPLAALVKSAHKPLPPVPPGAAFTLWTERGWTPQERSIAPLPPAAAFSIWTEPGFDPAHNAPNGGAAAPPLGGERHPQGTASENGDSAPLKDAISPAEAFHNELSGGAARNDYLLGIVFNEPPVQRDDLSKLDGITPSQRDTLEAFGVHRFKQIAFWNLDHAGEFARRLGLNDTARAANWIGQAVKLLQKTGGAES